MSAETKLKEELDKSKQQKEEQHQQDPDDAPGLLPPQALLSTPAPSTTEDTSALLSPWWSEEPQSADDHTSPITNQSNGHQNSILNISVLGVSRSSPKESKFQWKERCMLLAFTELQQQRQQQEQQQQQGTDEKDSQKQLLDILDRSKDCSMVCFLRTSRQLSKAQTSSLFHFNPFAGIFVSVAKSPARCKEHLLNATNMVTQKSFSDYYTMELGEELSHSSEHVTKAIQRTFGPLQRLTERYVNSWRDGVQQAFFSKFWSSLQKGDAFYLVKDSTKRLFENALGHDKKPSDKK
ncbi:hypothetical protein EDC96DRAFT_435836 [Choanephora cucurbitarum]|nr:hypothetical protein EDC96DRAFT_435836 [Choanephora cucurbitarum]